MAFVTAVSCAGGAGVANAASREPVSILEAALNGEGVELQSTSVGSGDRRPAAASAAVQGTAPSVSSSAYGLEQTEVVARIVAGFDHGPELAAQHLFVATPAEVASRCGGTVIACYFPGTSEMVVAGTGGARGGVPREFAIAHEYGHAIADSQTSPIGSAMETGTIRWATYERVCQLTRAGVVFPGNQGGRYWQDPEEAFAETYAHLTDPSASVSWQFSPYLAPTPGSLAKVRADVAHPWAGPRTRTWDGSVVAPAAPAEARRWGTDRAGISAARSLGQPPGTATKTFSTPLDGDVVVGLRTAASTPLVVRLLDPVTDRTLARSHTDAAGDATLSFQNCGHEALRVEVRDPGAAAVSFEAQITRP